MDSLDISPGFHTLRKSIGKGSSTFVVLISTIMQRRRYNNPEICSKVCFSRAAHYETQSLFLRLSKPKAIKNMGYRMLLARRGVVVE